MSKKIDKKDIIKEVEKRNYKFVRMYYNNNGDIRVIYKDNNDYKYDSLVGNIRKGYKPDMVRKENPFSHTNAVLWTKKNRLEFSISSRNKITDASTKFIFYHKKCRSNFLSSWTHFASLKFGCPICSGKQIGKYNNLGYLNPSLSMEWSDKNKKSPYEVTANSGKSFIWRCLDCEFEWKSRVADRSRGQGCPKCRKSSNGENRIRIFLKNNKIKFEEQKKFDGCKYKRKLPFDFYLPKYNSCIEFNGEQHYKEVRDNFFGKKYNLKERIMKDEIKISFCKENNIPLLIIPYFDMKNIEKNISNFLGNIDEN